MKKNQAHLRGSQLRRASRAEKRRAATAARVKIRKPSAVPVPWDDSSDNCKFVLAAGSYEAEFGSIDPLEALDPVFRHNAGWTRQPGPEPKRAINVMVAMHRPAPEFVAGSECRFVAVDSDTYQGSAVLDPAAHQEFWDHQMNDRPVSMQFLKSGAAIWKKLGIKISPESTAYMMQMKNVDAETSEAIQSAIWSAFNTASYPIDIETAVFVLAAFMHADPLRKQLVSDEAFIEPYGDRTRYALRDVYKLMTDEVAGDDDDDSR